MNIKKTNKFLLSIKTLEKYNIEKVRVEENFLYKITNIKNDITLNKIELYISDNYGSHGYKSYFFNEWLASPDLGHIYNRYYIKDFNSFEVVQTFEEALFLCIYKVEKKISNHIIKNNEDNKNDLCNFLKEYFIIEEDSETLRLDSKNLNLSYKIKKIEIKDNLFNIDNIRFHIYENDYYLTQSKSFIEALYLIYDKMSLKYFLSLIQQFKKL